MTAIFRAFRLALILLAAPLPQALAQPVRAEDLKKDYETSVLLIEGKAKMRNGEWHSWTGTGFVVSGEGHVLTSDHVVDDQDYVRDSISLVGRLGSREAIPLRLEVIKRDPEVDIALLKFASEVKNLRAVRITDSNSVRLGAVFVMGFPKTENLTVVEGKIGNLHARKGRFQTDAAVNYGNSGGPVFNEQAQVIAIVYGGDPGAVGLNFLVPINYARGLLSLTGPRF